MGKQDIQYAFERSVLWRLKLHLQHTGWLQFVPPLIIGQFFIFASRILEWYLLPSVSSAALLLWIGNLLLAIGIFDIITLKFNIRPSESIPGLLYDNNKDLSVMQQRRSCRSFQPRKLCKKHREEILRVAKAASKDTLGTSSPIRFEYIDSPLKVWPAVNSQEYLVAVGPAKYDRMAMIDVGRSLQNVVIHATKMGLATCWIGPGADHDSIIQAMETRGILYSDYRDHIVCVCAIGYKSFLVPTMVRIAMKLISSTRKPYNELFFSDIKFQQSLDITTYPFNRYTKCYEAARSSPSSFNAQPTQCVGIWDKDTETIRFDFFSSIKSRYYAPVAAGIWLSDWQIACQCVGIEGRFAVLSQEERGINECDESLPVLPYYNISWIEKCGWPKGTELSKKDVQM